jgi:hypothetical protein
MGGKIISSSFRDASGFIFTSNNILYRQINKNYKKSYDFLLNSGLFEKLTNEKLLINSEEVSIQPFNKNTNYKIIKPKFIPFISYPYEWCFSQLKDAALLTLKIQEISLKFNMTLKDSSAYNIQFLNGRPIFIDTLSFEKYNEGDPWIAYKQFCSHFLSPLLLMYYKDINLNKLLKLYIDGIPLELTSKLLPLKSRFSFSILSHIHLHAKSQKHYENKLSQVKKISRLKLSMFQLLAITNDLASIIKKLKWKPRGTQWANYYNETNYNKAAFKNKTEIITSLLNMANPETLWDLGANTGVFTRLNKNGKLNIAFDVDPAAVEINYKLAKQNNEENILPLVMDLTNPSSDIGWACNERASILKRGPADCIIALALIHHLSISNNVPFAKVAEFLKDLCQCLIIEFVPKEDSQVQKLLTLREDVFSEYSIDIFKAEFSVFFKIKKEMMIEDHNRTIFFMEKLKQ